MKRSWVMLAADTFAMIVFSTVMCMGIEVLVAGMTIIQSLVARAAAVPTNLLTGRPYGCYRDMLFRKLNLHGGGFLQTAFGDTVAFVSFQLPLYVFVLLLAHASARQILISGAMMTLVFSLAGRPYGIFMDHCRRMILTFFQR
jgi:hypothetical protein